MSKTQRSQWRAYYHTRHHKAVRPAQGCQTKLCLGTGLPSAGGYCFKCWAAATPEERQRYVQPP
jgi:hypothetical protein